MTRATKKCIKIICVYIVIGVMIWVTHTSLFAFYRIASGSMIPTVLVGDIVVSNELAYGLKMPTLNKYFFKTKYLFGKKNPKRGDIITFRAPADNPTEEGLIYVKRLVGVPGDRIKMVDGQLYINGEPTYREEISGVEYDLGKFEYFDLAFYKSSINGKNFTYMRDRDNYILSNMREIELRDDEYYVIGDNRDFSKDSRFFGPIHRDDILAKAVAIIFSMDVAAWPPGVGVYRPLRIIKKIE